MVIRNDPVTVKHTKLIFTDVGKVMMAFILATDFDFIAKMRKMASFFGGEAFFTPMAVLEYDPSFNVCCYGPCFTCIQKKWTWPGNACLILELVVMFLSFQINLVWSLQLWSGLSWTVLQDWIPNLIL